MQKQIQEDVRSSN